jgi:hypothetical protein
MLEGVEPVVDQVGNRPARRVDTENATGFPWGFAHRAIVARRAV